MKLESLVIADQHAAVNTFSGLVHTARHTMRAGNTRYPYENVGMDHLLSKEKDVRKKTFSRGSEWKSCSVLRDL